MILLFGAVPSWYSWPCERLVEYMGPVICKRRLETWRPLPYHVSSRNYYITCHSKQILVLSRCFSMRWDLNALPLNEPVVSRDVEEYFIKMFSFITRQTMLGYQLLMKTHFSGSNENGTCIKILLTPGLPYDITRQVITYKSQCRSMDSDRILSISLSHVDPRLHCQTNQITCKDGTCLSHKSVCSWYNHCHTMHCTCQSNGKPISDKYFCRYICLPKNCTCPRHHFQCTSGGCIHMSYICDGESHCRDSSDEICRIDTFVHENHEKEKEVLLTAAFRCLGFMCHSGLCIPCKNIDDLIPDCPGGMAEDEPQFLQLRHDSRHHSCDDNTQIPCVPGLSICFALERLCLHDSDEDGNLLWCRNGAHLGDCSHMNCTNSYKCPNSYCIPFHHVCDGHPDCIHGEDEERCNEYSCKGLLRCTATKICVHSTHVCDGVRNCPRGDDEELCGMSVCPHDCNCFSYSITCTVKVSNKIPTMPGNFFKHIAIVFSRIPHPDFNSIRDQRGLLVLNLTKNHIQNVCGPLQSCGRFCEKLTILDVSRNEINSLWSKCFAKLSALKILSLAYNPLHTIPRDSLSSLSISYISLRRAEINSLHGHQLHQIVNQFYLDMTEIHLNHMDSSAIETLSQYYDLRFDDSRLCCIFIRNKYCLYEASVLGRCPTILPHRLIGYIILLTGGVIVVINGYALYANFIITRGSLHSQIMYFLILVDFVLASYLPIIGAVDVYYKSYFALAVERWQQGVVCRMLETLSTITIILSPFLSGLLVFLTSQGIANAEFNIMDNSRFIIFIMAGTTFTTICFSVFLTIANIVANDKSGKRYVCNMLGYISITSKADLSFAITLSILMVALTIWIATSAMKLILHIRRTTKEVERISKMKLKSSQGKGGACKFMILLIIMKSIIFVPYPLLHLVNLLVKNVPETTSLYVMLSFTVLESSLNPIVFVLRPLLRKRKRIWIIKTYIDPGNKNHKYVFNIHAYSRQT